MSHILGRFNRHQQARQDHDNITRIINEGGTQEAPPTVTRATLPGDTRRLRGIPAVARGVPGASPGTNPEQAILRTTRYAR